MFHHLEESETDGVDRDAVYLAHLVGGDGGDDSPAFCFERRSHDSLYGAWEKDDTGTSAASAMDLVGGGVSVVLPNVEAASQVVVL
ncbi:hypothetical protein, partial [Haloarcula sp. Atlit-7R]|uniref:hypothetical protein n=1 Tax=Haloarcula sp. Atlit-7R TaxID=2282125 RepID=UPI001F1A8C45